MYIPLSPANTHIQKNTQKSTEVHVKIKTTKLLEENMGINLYKPGLRDNSSVTSSSLMTEEIWINWTSLKSKWFIIQSIISKEPIGWEKYFKSHFL